MVVLGLVLLAIGVLAGVAAALSSSGSASFLGADLSAATLFFLGVAAALAVVGGLMLTRAGTGRALRNRRDHRRLRALERERQRTGDAAGTDRDGDDRARPDPTA